MMVQRRGGQNIQIETMTKITKTKMEKLHQNKHKKRCLSELDQINSVFIVLWSLYNTARGFEISKSQIRQ